MRNFLEKLYLNNRILKGLIRLYYKKIRRDNIKLAKIMGVNIGDKCVIYDDPTNVFGTEPWLVEIGDHVEICNGVEFVTHRGELWVARALNKKLEYMDSFEKIVIGNNVFVGAHSFILPGIKIGENVVIGAGSIITKDIPDNSVVAGNPASIIASTETLLSNFGEKYLCYPTKKMKPLEKKRFIKNI